MKNLLIILAAGMILSGCGSEAVENTEIPNVQQETQSFLDSYSKTFQQLYYQSAEAEWRSNTMIIEGDSTNTLATQKANEAMAEFTGSEENIKKAKSFLDAKDQLTPIQVKQLEVILYSAANNPAIVKEVVKERIKAETEQNDQLFGFTFKINGREVTTNDIDRILKEETNVTERQKAWEASKEVGKNLKAGLTKLQKLRNETVQALDYKDYFSYQVSEYNMTTEEMRDLMQQLMKEIWPLYRELHTWARYELAEKYGVNEVPGYLPAHWLPNRWGQDWSSLVKVEGIDLDGILKEKGAEWIVTQGEEFYKSLGFAALPQSFYEKSSLYPLPDSVDYKKNNHASAWHLNLEDDVRSLMSVEANAEWYETVLHELGHIYYFMTYTNPDVPVLLRGGANRGFHEAMGSLIGLAAMQKPFLQELNLIAANSKTDEAEQIQSLLKEALNYIVFIPWSSGVMSEFEYELYANNLPADQYNAKWWDIKKKYQGIVPPTERGEDYCDAASKTHINNDAAQYYDYAISYVLLFQLHDHIANRILKQDPHATNYYANKKVGEFLKGLMYPGASTDWRKLMEEKLGEGLSAKPMLRYFEPLMEYLKKENEGRKYTLPENVVT